MESAFVHSVVVRRETDGVRRREDKDAGKMRAARYYGKEDIRIEDVAEQKCGAGQVRIAPAYVGICGTDLHEFLGGPTFAPTKPHPVTHDTIPITLGHEFSGTVTELGPDVTSLSVGQHIVVQPTIYCGSCEACSAGVENLCYNGGFIGLSGGGGGLSDSVVVPAGAVLALPNNIALDVGALVEPLSVAWHAISAAPVSSDSVVMVLGGGPIGLAIVQCLVALDVKTIIVSEVSSSRQQFARNFGAHHVIDPKATDTVALSRELSGKDGPDVVFDCAGVPASLKTACTAVRARGTVVNVAIWEKEVPFNPNMLVFREAKYTAVLGYQRRDVQAVIDQLAAGKLKPSQMITSKIQLEDLVEGGIKALINDKESHVKILVEANLDSSTNAKRMRLSLAPVPNLSSHHGSFLTSLTIVTSVCPCPMSNYGSMPPPGPYAPPPPGSHVPPQQGSQPGSGHKPGGMYGQVMQAVSTSKPMLDKLGKTISSKLAGKQGLGGPPQHLQSYQNYQQHQGQARYAPPPHFQQPYQGQPYSPQPQQQQQQQWVHSPHTPHPPPPQATNAYSAQPSPYQTPTYATPPNHATAQGSYFPAPPSPNALPPRAPTAGQTPHNTQHYVQQEQHELQGSAQGQYQQPPSPQAGQYAGQHGGVVGGTASPGYAQNTHMGYGDVSPLVSPNTPSPWNKSPNLAPPPPPPRPPPQAYQALPSPSISPAPSQSQWRSQSPLSPQHQAPPRVVSPPRHAASPPPAQAHSHSQPGPGAAWQATQPPRSQSAPSDQAPGELVAELPGDMGNMHLGGSSTRTPSPYQAYRPPGGGQATWSASRCAVPRRGVGASHVPLGDPWRFADPVTEQPTGEFYIVADLIFDALDRKFDPQNTGLLEAPKVLECWLDITPEAREVFRFNNYQAFARLWSLEGIPHMMVPVQASLSPIWNFRADLHAREFMAVDQVQTGAGGYMPALNRAGWYRYFFLEMLHGPEEISRLLPALCADRYEAALEQAEVARGDGGGMAALQAKAARLQTMAIRVVCEEAKQAMDRL
ncbi:hypothetical protein ACEQ8H_002041 [Pleosporales sp. CAS-2024a]